MRSMMRTALVAVAVLCAVPSAPALAQAPKQTRPVPTPAVAIEVTKVPKNVMNVFKKAFPTAKITKVERIGAAKTATYHFLMTGAKVAEASVTAAGKLIRK